MYEEAGAVKVFQAHRSEVFDLTAQESLAVVYTCCADQGSPLSNR